MPLDHADAAIGQRQATQPVDDLGQPLVVAEQQQDVAGLDLQLAHPIAKPPALPRDAEQRHAMAVEQPHVEGRAAGRCEHLPAPRPRPARASRRPRRRASRRRRTRRPAAPTNCSMPWAPPSITTTSPLRITSSRAAPGSRLPRRTSPSRLTSFSSATSSSSRTRLPIALAPLRHLAFGDVALAGLAQLPGAVVRPARRPGSAASRPARRTATPTVRDHQPDRREVEHPVRLTQRLLAEGGDDDVGRRADQGDHAAEDRGEGERHQGQRRAALGLAPRPACRPASAAPAPPRCS